MARLFLSFAFAVTTATLVLFGLAVAPASAQMPPAIPSAAPKPKSYPEAQQAVDLLVKRDYPGAIRKLEEASRKYDELPSAHVLMYQILGQLAQANQPNAAAAARNELEEAVKAGPSDPEPYVILANIALQERRVAEAALDLDKAKQLLVSYPNAKRKGAMEQQTMSGIALLAESRQEWKVAEALLRDLLKLAPEDLNTHQRLARSLFWQTKAIDAYDVLKKAKKIDRDNAAKNKTREVFLTPEAIMAQYYDQFEVGVKPPTGNAETWFTAAIKNAKDDLTTRQVVAIWALDKGKIPFAKEQAENALRIEKDFASKWPGSNVGRMLRGLVALWQKDWLEAERNFKAIIDENPNDFGAKNNLALALVEQDDQAKKNRALAYAEANYRENGKSPDALSTLGWVYFRRGEFDQARVVLDQALKASGGNMNADTATYVAHILHHQQQDWQAKEILKSILDADRPFSMRPEAEKLLDKVKDAAKPVAATGTPAAAAAKTP